MLLISRKSNVKKLKCYIIFVKKFFIYKNMLFFQDFVPMIYKLECDVIFLGNKTFMYFLTFLNLS